MKGRDSFSAAEIAELRRLIAERQTADRSRQKALRRRMRVIGFYITDFVTDQKGFTVSDFDELLERGRLSIDEDAVSAPSPRPGPRRRPAIDDQAVSSDAGREEVRARRDRAAAEFKPDRIELLLVAEAPPSALDRYFYFTDVREQDSLFRHVCRGVLGRVPARQDKAQLLAELRDRGVFLIDLQQEPRDGTPLGRFVPELVERCRALDPERIILIKATVFDAAYEPLREVGLPVSDVRLPFPGSGRQREFEKAFARALARGNGVQAE